MGQAIKSKKGFTIIEVVLVLAIAALIFLIVFLAVPALQRNQRDTQRRSDTARAISQLQSYASNHNGTVPNSQASLTTFMTSYLNGHGSSFTDPLSGNTYNFVYQAAGSSARPAAPGDLFYYAEATCTNGSLAASTGNARSVAVLVYLEASGDTFCQNN